MSVFGPADILIPRVSDFEKWAVVACDQFSSQPEYWEEVRAQVGAAPSALNLILPEAELGGEHERARTEAIHETMRTYAEDGLFALYPQAYVYVERTLQNGMIRKGLIGAVDLEAYDYQPGADAAIRATEKTVVERIPPRMNIRRGALLELPHIILLCDDARRTLIEPVAAAKDGFDKLYEFDLMQGGGHIAGWLVSGEAARAFDESLAAYSAGAQARYAGLPGRPMLFAAGDGNHSLATAKACYEELKQKRPGMDFSRHPARYALVELENIHDEAQIFEPIHRIVTGVDAPALLGALRETSCAGDGYPVEWIMGEAHGTVYLDRSKSQLAVGVLQAFLDDYLKTHGGETDYIHGEDVLMSLARQENAIGFLLAPMEKSQLFAGVIADGMLPRKTFSMGHAQEKRYYLEARAIQE
ncbi:MAG: DUF1015 domain-containing protein [Clostridia bacterium]|nr:DUF1015 domain-containing protein [Clostridia bacterium]